MDPLDRARLLVAQWYNKKVVESGNPGDLMISPTDDVKVVWFAYILGGWKSLLIINGNFGPIGGCYFEVTYNQDKGETYVDVYRKQENIPVKDGEWLHSFEEKAPN